MMNTNVMTMAAEYTCIHEEQIQGISRKTAELEARADYKEQSIKELKSDMKELKDSVDSLDNTINKFIIQSIKDDNTLKDYITSLENRVTSLESRQDTLYKLLMATPAVIAGIGVIAAVLTYTH